MSGLTGCVVGRAFLREMAADIGHTRLLAPDRGNEVVLGSNELHEGTLAPLLRFGIVSHGPGEGQTASSGALVMVECVFVLGEVAAGVPPDREAVLCLVDPVEMCDTRADPAANARWQVASVHGYVEHGHEHVVVVVRGLRASPLMGGSVAVVPVGGLDPPDASVGSGQTLGEGNQ